MQQVDVCRAYHSHLLQYLRPVDAAALAIAALVRCTLAHVELHNKRVVLNVAELNK